MNGGAPMAGSAPGRLRAVEAGVELLGRDVFWGRVLASVESAYASRSMPSRVLLETKRQSERGVLGSQGRTTWDAAVPSNGGFFAAEESFQSESLWWGEGGPQSNPR
jgi:hypothetical protein